MIPRSKLLRDRNKPLARQWLCFYQDTCMTKCPCGRKCRAGREIFNPFTFERLVIGKCCAQALKLKTIDSNAVLFDVTWETNTDVTVVSVQSDDRAQELDQRTRHKDSRRTDVRNTERWYGATRQDSLGHSRFRFLPFAVSNIGQDCATKCGVCQATTEKEIPTDLTIGFQRLDLLRQKVRDPRMKLPKPLHEQVRDEFNANVREQYNKSEQ